MTPALISIFFDFKFILKLNTSYQLKNEINHCPRISSIFSLHQNLSESKECLYFYRMKKIFYLSSCDTCRRIMKQFDFKDFQKQDIKTQLLNEQQIEEMKKRAGTYEALFSRKARKYKELGLKDKVLNEKDYKDFILSDYTFLKRPVIIDENKIFIGSDKKNLENLDSHLNG